MITHKTSLKANLHAALEHVKLPQAEVTKLEPKAINYYNDNKDDIYAIKEGFDSNPQYPLHSTI